MDNIDLLIRELCKLSDETGWVEFKHNNTDPVMIGEDLSALANSASLLGHSHGYMVWGIEDSTHEIIGTQINLKHLKKGAQELENWLHYLLSNNADFEFCSTEIDGKHIELIIIAKAAVFPVSFEKIDYIRIGSYTKKLTEFPILRAQLWDSLRKEQFEDIYAMTGLSFQDVTKLLNCDAYFDMLKIPMPNSIDNIKYYLIEDGIIVKQDNGLFSITNLGAILLAKKLSDFQRISRKAVRIIRYEGTSRLSIRNEEEINEGYAKAIEKVVDFAKIMLPSKEDLSSTIRTTTYCIPFPAVRETIANSLIHQDLFITGTGPVIEVFDNRVEVTNPGRPLVDVMRIVDNPPKSRNEKLAAMLRRMGLCEELGRGWDRIVISCEMQSIPAPRINLYEEATKITLFTELQYPNIPQEDKLWSTYLHACVKYTEGDALTNSSLRKRFGLKESSSGSISRLIKEAVEQKLIKPLEADTAKRYMKYIPCWA